MSDQLAVVSCFNRKLIADGGSCGADCAFNSAASWPVATVVALDCLSLALAVPNAAAVLIHESSLSRCQRSGRAFGRVVKATDSSSVGEIRVGSSPTVLIFCFYMYHAFCCSETACLHDLRLSTNADFVQKPPPSPKIAYPRDLVRF